ncbi:MAG: hypothetical protein ACPL28_11070 [bacterium]
MSVDSFDQSPSYCSDYRLINIYRSGLSPYVITAYSGCKRTARQNDNLNDTVAFKIRVRVEDTTGFGQNNKQVFFMTNKGRFVESGSNTWTGTTGTIWSFPGIVEATLNLSELSGGSGGADYDYSVYASLTEAGVINRIFNERCIIDYELSGLPYPYSHKRLNVNNSASEIPGDNLPNGSNEDPNSGIKDVFVEVDYSLAIPEIDSSLDKICTIAEKYALERGKLPGDTTFYSSGIDIHFVIDEACFIPKYATDTIIKTILWQTRDSVRYIHCLLGHYYQNLQGDTCDGGVSIGWTFRNNNWPYAQRMFHAGVLSSNEAIGNYHIDSMGCFVACERIYRVCQQVGIGTYWWEVAGVALAHEIGHALGLAHTPANDGKNIMKDKIDVYAGWMIDEWGFFLLNRLHDSDSTKPYIYGLDLLNKLGVETGSLGDHAFDRP